MMSDPIYMSLSDLEARLERYEHNLAELKSRDKVASEMEWDRVHVNPFETGQRSLKLTGQHTAKMSVKFSAALVSAPHLIVGLGMLYLSIDWYLNEASSKDVLGMGFMGLAFTLLGAVMFYQTNVPQKFDRHLGVYWRGFLKPKVAPDTSSEDGVVLLREVYAVQVACYKNNERPERDLYSYGAQINLILRDGRRCPIVESTDLALIQSNAEELSRFLNVRLWAPGL